MTNFDVYKQNLTLKSLTNLILAATDNGCFHCPLCNDCELPSGDCETEIRQWLKTEVEVDWILDWDKVKINPVL